MEITAPKPQLSALLSNDVLARAERLRLSPIRRLTDQHRGEHLRGRGGSSTEFSDYRDYVAGDDVRFVDWNIFSRLHRPYLKLYRLEEEMNVVLLIDGSTSMLFEDKLRRAAALAAAFGLMGLMGGERGSAYVFHQNGAAPMTLPPCTGRVSRRKLLHFLEGALAIEGGDAPLEAGVDEVLKRHRGRGVAVLLSDFLTFADLKSTLNRVFSAGLEPMALQILGPSEIDPDLTGDVRMVDSELDLTLDVSAAGDLLSIYHEYRIGLEEQLATLCKQRGGRALTISSQEPIEKVLFDQLRRQAWVR